VEVGDVYAELMTKLNYVNSDYLRRVLQKLVTPEEGRLLLKLPADPAELAQELGWDVETVNRKLRELQERGLVVTTRKGLRFVRDVTQLHDITTASSDKWVDTELLDLWREFYENEWHDIIAGFMESSEEHPHMRVIPAWKSIESCSEVPPDQNIREIIRGAESIAVVPCSCRKIMRRCDAPVDICFQFDRWADYHLDRGAGRRLSVDEAMALADVAGEAGLVHTQMIETPALSVICNCCSDCCGLLDPGNIRRNWKTLLARSAYQASINQDLCTGCQDCVERCPFYAIDMERVPGVKKLKAAVEPDKCFGCGVCAVGCSTGAISMRLVRERETLPI